MPIASIILLTGTDSPVSAASSIWREADSMILPSAGTASPASRTITSPGTSSSEWRDTCSPSLMTLQVAAVIVWSASIAASALLSWSTPRMALRSTTMRMMNTSASPSGSAGFWMLCRIVVPADTAAATIRMISIGSFSCSMKRWKFVFFSASFSLLWPYFSSLF